MSELTLVTPGTAPWRDLDARATDGTTVIRRRARHGSTVSWRLLSRRTAQLASALHAAGVRRGDRVAVLARTGPTRTAVAYACWRLGAVVVAVADDASRREQARALDIARPVAVVGDRAALLLTRRLPSVRLRVGTERLPLLDAPVLGSRLHVADLVARHLLVSLPAAPDPDDEAALLFARPEPGEDPVGVFYTQRELGHVGAVVVEQLLRGTQDGREPGRVLPAVLGRTLPVGSTRRGSVPVAASLVAPGFPTRRRAADTRALSAWAREVRARDLDATRALTPAAAPVRAA